MHVEPIVLEGRAVRLEPLGAQHAEGLLAAADPDIFAYLSVLPPAWTPEGFRQYVGRLLAQPGWQYLAMVERATDRAVGVSSYNDIRPEHRGLEIGGTWIGSAYQGTAINPECKYLMLRHAFEDLGAVRVQLKTDGLNIHSQRAIAKLGAQYEGTLRKHFIMPDGFIRDTVMYSITEEEWPAVKCSLERRLGYAP